MLQGEVAVITGGGRGIGRAIAIALAAQGASVALAGRGSAALEETAVEIRAAGGKVATYPCDVVDGEALTGMLAAAQRDLGPLTLLVNNAGLGDGGLIWEMDPEAWWRVQEVNFKAPYLASREVLPDMVKRGAGRIINVGSFAANSAGQGGSAYSTSKAALQRLTEGMAADMAGTGVSAFCVSPGFVWTDMGREYDAFLRANVPGFEGMDDAWVYPVEAVAELCVRLARGDADALSGRFIHVRDDLDSMIADSERIIEEELHQLRFRLPPEP